MTRATQNLAPGSETGGSFKFMGDGVSVMLIDGDNINKLVTALDKNKIRYAVDKHFGYAYTLDKRQLPLILGGLTRDIDFQNDGERNEWPWPLYDKAHTSDANQLEGQKRGTAYQMMTVSPQNWAGIRRVTVRQSIWYRQVSAFANFTINMSGLPLDRFLKADQQQASDQQVARVSAVEEVRDAILKIVTDVVKLNKEIYPPPLGPSNLIGAAQAQESNERLFRSLI